MYRASLASNYHTGNANGKQTVLTPNSVIGYRRRYASYYWTTVRYSPKKSFIVSFSKATSI